MGQRTSSMSSGSANLLPELRYLLARCRDRARSQIIRRGFAATAIVFFAAILFACLADWILILSSPTRLLMLLGIPACSAMTAWLRLLRPLRVPVSEQELAAAVDLQYPGLQESISTLATTDPTDSASRALLQGLQKSVRRQLESIHPGRIIQTEVSRRLLRIAVAVIVLLVLPVLIWPDPTSLLLNRLLTPFANLESPTRLFFEVPNGSRIVAIGANTTVVAIPGWRSGSAGPLPDAATVELISAQAAAEQLSLTWNSEKGQFETVIRDVRDDLRYRIRSGSAVSKWHQLTAVSPPRIETAVLLESPPAYCLKPAVEHNGVVGELRIFERSRIEIQLRFNQAVDTFLLKWSEWKPLPSVATNDKDRFLKDQEEGLLPEEIAALAAGEAMAEELERESLSPADLTTTVAPDRLSASVAFTATGSGRMEFLLTDNSGLANQNEPERRITLVRDAPPVLTVTGLRNGLEVRPDDSIPLRYQVTDDFGLGSVEFLIVHNENDVLSIPASPLVPGEKTVEEELLLDLSQFSAKSGDLLEITAVATDQRPEPGPQSVTAGPWSLIISESAAPLGRDDLTEADQQLLDALRAQLVKLDEDLQQLEQSRQTVRQNWGPDRQQETALLAESQQTAGNRLHQLAGETAAHPLMQQQAADLSAQAEALRNDTAAALYGAAESESVPAGQFLLDAAEEMRSVRAKLAKTIDEIHRLADLEQELTELNRLAVNAQQLAEDSRQYQQQRDSGIPQEGQTEQQFLDQLFQEQMRLQSEQQQLSTDLADLLQRQQELLQAAREAQLEQAELISEGLQMIAARQQNNADGIKASAESSSATALLQQLQQQLTRLHQQVSEQQPGIELPDPLPVSSIEPQELSDESADHTDVLNTLKTFAKQLRQAAEQLADSDNETMQSEITNVDQLLEDLVAKLSEPITREDAPPPTADADSPSQTPPNAAVEAAMKLLEQAILATAESASRDNGTARSKHSDAKTAAELQQAMLKAQGGQFSEAARILQQAAAVPEETPPGEEAPINSVLRKLAGSMAQLQNSPAARLEIQQRSQQQIVDQSQPVPEMLQDLAERLQLPAIGLTQQGQAATDAADSASRAVRDAVSTAEQLQLQQMTQAGQDAAAAAAQFREAIQQSLQASTGPRNPANPVPTDVGESVGDALHSLQQAAEMMLQESMNSSDSTQDSSQQPTSANAQQSTGDQPGAPEPGQQGSQSSADEQSPGNQRGGPMQESSGQQNSGQPSPSADQSARELAQAARSLQQAASRSIPSQFTPGQLSSDNASNQSTAESRGNPAQFDGLDPLSKLLQGTRGNWGQLQDQLGDDVRDAGREVLDTEYSELIRRYRKNLAEHQK